jgi:hypothetical protein
MPRPKPMTEDEIKKAKKARRSLGFSENEEITREKLKREVRRKIASGHGTLELASQVAALDPSINASEARRFVQQISTDFVLWKLGEELDLAHNSPRSPLFRADLRSNPSILLIGALKPTNSFVDAEIIRANIMKAAGACRSDTDSPGWNAIVMMLLGLGAQKGDEEEEARLRLLFYETSKKVGLNLSPHFDSPSGGVSWVGGGVAEAISEERVGGVAMKEDPAVAEALALLNAAEGASVGGGAVTGEDPPIAQAHAISDEGAEGLPRAEAVGNSPVMAEAFRIPDPFARPMPKGGNSGSSDKDAESKQSDSGSGYSQ